MAMGGTRRVRWAAALAAAGMLCAATRAEEAFAPPRIGPTLKGDAVNRVGVVGAKAWLLDALAVEGGYVGAGGNFTGYAVRGVWLAPADWRAGPATLRPYLAAGYADIREDVSVSGGTVDVAGETIRWGVAGSGQVACRGRGLQVACGLQANPFRRFPRLFLEAELMYSLFDVEGRGASRVEGTGLWAPYAVDAEVTVESDFNALGFLLGATVYF